VAFGSYHGNELSGLRGAKQLVELVVRHAQQIHDNSEWPIVNSRL